MTPRLTRRRCIGALSLFGATSLAGCTESLTGDDGPSTDDGTDTDEPATGATETPDGKQTDAVERRGPEATVEAYLEATGTADDLADVGAYFHPLHPLHPDNLDGDEGERWVLRDEGPADIETVTVDQEVTAATVFESPLLRTAVEEDAVADALDGEETAVVEATVTEADGETGEFRLVTVTVDGEWTILAQGVGSDDADTGEARDGPVVSVVDDVTFDADADTARVQFVDSPAVDSVTVEAKNAFSSRSSDTPEPLDSLTVSLDPGGDAVVVTVTVDGESRTVHRERYPESHRVVEEITQEQAETDVLGERARVTFTGNQEGDRLRVESTVADGEGTAEPAGPVNYLTLGVDPEGDRVVVTLTDDGETTEVHRERYRPDGQAE